jgi:CHAD domain-containing protein
VLKHQLNPRLNPLPNQHLDRAPKVNIFQLTIFSSAAMNDQPPTHQVGHQTIGDFTVRVIGKQCQHLFSQKEGVLADQDPECLHQMRVRARRLRTALRVFAPVIQLPEPAQEKEVQQLARTLGALRDIDVQKMTLLQVYRPHVSNPTQQALDNAIAILDKLRLKAFKKVQKTLHQKRYQFLRTTYDLWLMAPELTTIAPLNLMVVLPDLLSPLLSQLLLHPGWLIPEHPSDPEALHCLHDLRKLCKYARYQAEFFERFYPPALHDWISEIKTLQESLGQVQDTQVLEAFFAEHLQGKAAKHELQAKLLDDRTQALNVWEPIRQRYLDQSYRYSLHHLILNPKM